jgi:hypothetical protein
VHRALLGIAEALAAVGVEEMPRGHVAGADGGIVQQKMRIFRLNSAVSCLP